MTSEYLFSLDPYNFDDEIKYHLFFGDINDMDLEDFLFEGRISQSQHDDYLDFYNYYLEVACNG